MHEALKEVKEEGPNASGAQFNVKFWTSKKIKNLMLDPSPKEFAARLLLIEDPLLLEYLRSFRKVPHNMTSFNHQHQHISDISTPCERLPWSNAVRPQRYACAHHMEGDMMKSVRQQPHSAHSAQRGTVWHSATNVGWAKQEAAKPSMTIHPPCESFDSRTSWSVLWKLV